MIFFAESNRFSYGIRTFRNPAPQFGPPSKRRDRLFFIEGSSEVGRRLPSPSPPESQIKSILLKEILASPILSVGIVL